MKSVDKGTRNKRKALPSLVPIYDRQATITTPTLHQIPTLIHHRNHLVATQYTYM